MRRTRWLGGTLLTLVAALLLSSAGCGGGKDDKKTTTAPTTTGQASDDKSKDPKHAGWWCTEHGVPEHMCSLCLGDDEVQKQFKSKKDWCKIHERAQSQCFKCNPKLYEKFEAMYEAKYGKKPPAPPKEEFEDETKKKGGKA